jgi:hypothetical protein
MHKKKGIDTMAKKTMKKTVTKLVIGGIILPAVALAVRKRIFQYIDDKF